MATRERIPSQRSSASPWEEASTAHARSPASTIACSSLCRSTASAVVRPPGCSMPPTTTLMVPISPHGRPEPSSIARTMNVVVVLPFVPVTATTASSALGSPWKRAAAGPIAERTEPTTTSGTPRPSGRSTTSAAAPRCTASGAKSWPS